MSDTDGSTENTDNTDSTGSTLQIDEVVVAWKPTDASQAALDWALERIDRLRAPLTLVKVFDPRKEHDAAGRAAIMAQLEELADAARAAHPDTTVATRVLDGDPVKEISALTKTGVIVVVGTDRRRGLSIKYSFSFGTKVSARANGPVALIPHGLEARGEAAPAGVVVGVDGSEPSLRAARLAAEVAASRGDELIVAHVWQEPTPWQDAYLPPDDQFLQSLQQVHQDVLDESVDRFAADFPGLPITKRLVHGLAPWALLDQAADAALLVVGNHGLRGIQRFFLGSVSHTIVLNLEGPALVVPQR